MSRDFIGSATGRSFLKSQNRDRVTRGGVSLSNFYYCGAAGNAAMLIPAGNRNQGSAAFNPPGFCRASVTEIPGPNGPVPFKHIVAGGGGIGVDFPAASSLFGANQKIRMVVDVVGFSNLYKPERPYVLGFAEQGDPELANETDTRLEGELDYLVDVNYVNRGSAAFISFSNFEVQAQPDGWTAYESGTPTNGELLQVGSAANQWVQGRGVLLNKHATFQRTSGFWRKRVTIVGRMTRAQFLGINVTFRLLSRSVYRRAGTTEQWQFSDSSFSTNLAATNPTSPISGEQIFRVAPTVNFDPRYTEIVTCRFTSFDLVSDTTPIATTWEDVAV